MTTQRREYDHIVVGAGSAGCALAARLAEDGTQRVLLIEAGPRDRHPMFHIPLASGKALRSGAYGWGDATEPDDALAGRSIAWPRAKVLGGCSAINGMVYLRGHPTDFDAWSAQGNRGWSYAEVLPYFKRAEGHVDRRDDPYHGTQGPLAVSRAPLTQPIYEAFVQAGVEAGFGRTDDFNGAQQDGFGHFDLNIRDGRRWSSSVAYLHRSRADGRPDLLTGTLVTRVVLEGARATGVEFRRGTTVAVVRSNSITLCAGTINSPQLLLLSGIGDPAQLHPVGIEVRHALPGVGKNLHDHTGLPVMFACPLPVTLHSMIRADRIALAMAQAVLFRSGPATTFQSESGAFTRSEANLAAPDIQFHLINALGISRLRWPGWLPHRADPLEREGFMLHVCLLTPRSRGSIRLASSDPSARPRIAANWLADPHDMCVLVRALGQARAVASQRSLAAYITEELAPGAAVQDRKSVEQWIRRACGSVHHQVGTCKMGRDADAVVDDQLRVHGIAGLRVADASVMPTITRGNTNAATIMIAEKAADFLRARPVLTPEHIGAASERSSGHVAPEYAL